MTYEEIVKSVETYIHDKIIDFRIEVKVLEHLVWLLYYGEGCSATNKDKIEAIKYVRAHCSSIPKDIEDAFNLLVEAGAIVKGIPEKYNMSRKEARDFVYVLLMDSDMAYTKGLISKMKAVQPNAMAHNIPKPDYFYLKGRPVHSGSWVRAGNVHLRIESISKRPDGDFDVEYYVSGDPKGTTSKVFISELFDLRW